MLTATEIRAIINDCLKRAGFDPASYHITFSMNNRFTRRLGDASIRGDRSYLLRFSSKLFSVISKEEQEETVRHEMAHVCAWIASKNRYHHYEPPHGTRWQMYAVIVGAKPKAMADWKPEFAKFTRRQRRYDATCPCQKHKISGRVKTKIQQGFQYRCTKCKGLLRLCMN